MHVLHQLASYACLHAYAICMRHIGKKGVLKALYAFYEEKKTLEMQLAFKNLCLLDRTWHMPLLGSTTVSKSKAINSYGLAS